MSTRDRSSGLGLRASLENGEFWKLPTRRFLGLIKEEYLEELERLKTAYSIPTPTSERPATSSPSMTLYGAEFDEINRTLLSVLSLRWIYNKDYVSFVGTQPPAHRLTRQSFDWLARLFHAGIKNSNDLYLLVTSIVINDLGKSPTLAIDYQRTAKVDISNLNHDMVLYQVVTNREELIPSLARLQLADKQDLVSGIKLGAEFNFGQLAQAENIPACLLGLRTMSGLPRSFEMHFMEQLLDIAGAAGHADHTHAGKLTEPIFQSYKNVYDISLAIINGKLTVRDGYDLNLSRKVNTLIGQGWVKGKQLVLSHSGDRALMRLLCICNVIDGEGADLVHAAFYDVLDNDNRDHLIQGLNIDGSLERPAVLATYSPAMCSAALQNTRTGAISEQKLALAAFFRFLARTLVANVDQAFPCGVTVIERNVRSVLMHTVNSDDFRQNPGILDEVDIPEGQVAILSDGYNGCLPEIQDAIGKTNNTR